MNIKQLTAGIILGAAAIAVFNILPVYLGAVAKSLDLTADRIGFLAMVEAVSVVVIAALGPLWIRMLNWRKLAYFAIFVLIIGNGLCMLVDSYQLLVIARLLTGVFGSGLGYALAVAIVSEADKPDRAFGLAIVLMVIAGAIGLYLIPFFTPQWGMDAPFAYLIILAMLCLPVLRWCPEKSVKLVQHETTSPNVYPLYVPILGLVVHAVWYLNVGAFWAFIERIGDNAGLTETEVGLALTVGMITGLLGAAMAAVFDDRFGRVWPMACTLLIHIVTMYLLAGAMSTAKLAVIVAVYNVSWNFGLAYILGLIASSDSAGRVAVVIPVAQAVGTGGGPALAGMIAVQYGYGSISIFAIICCLIALVIYFPFALRVVRKG